MKIYFDIETIPTQSQQAIAMIAAEIKPPAQMKKPETIAEWEATQKQSAIDEAVLKTSFDGALGQICCIGLAIDDHPAQAFIGQESDILIAFGNALEAAYDPSKNVPPVFIGHNVSAFDLRFLFQRYVINGIKPPRFIPFNDKSWSERIFDTMTYFSGYGNRISLDKLSLALGLEGKGGITGADVWPMYQAGKIQDIADYCIHDVDLTREVEKRLTFTSNKPI